MKLRNLFIAGLAVCTLASCSKDEEAIDNGPKEPVDASISIAASAVLKTKATETEEGLSKENYVNTLTAYVFKEDGSFASKKTLDYATVTDNDLKGPNGLVGINHIIVKISPKSEGVASDDKFKLVLVANGKDLDVASLDKLQEAVITDEIGAYTVGNLTAATPKYLPMASQVLTIGGLVPNVKTKDGTTSYVENWIKGNDLSNPIQMEGISDPTGIPSGLDPTKDYIKLTRLIARVQVESLSVNFENYPGAAFQLNSLSLVNVRSTATLNGGNGDYVKGYQSGGYKPADKWIKPAAAVVASLGKNDYKKTLGTGEGFSTTISWGDTDVNKFFAYAFPNGVKTAGSTDEYETALLISGKFYRTSQYGEVRNFRVFLQDPNDASKAIQVLANNIYKLNVTITGEGSPNEDEILLNAHVGVKIEVNPWNVIIQNEEDAN